MKRKVTIYETYAVTLDEDCNPVEQGPVRTTSSNAVAVRAALREAGIATPRNVRLRTMLVGVKTYECSLEEFLSVAHEVDEDGE